MVSARYIAIALLISLVAGFGNCPPSAAQSITHVDSARVARMIGEIAPGPTIGLRARKALLALLEAGETQPAIEVMAFMETSAPNGQAMLWITPAERLLAETIAANPRLIMSYGRLGDLLDGWRRGPRQHADFTDGLYGKLRDLLRRSSGQIAEELTRWNIDGAGRLFYTILMNHLLVSGIRGREKLNALIDRLVSDYPESELVDLARDHIVFVYHERPFGVAIHVGYATGGFDGQLAEAFQAFYGPVFGAEFYLWEMTVSVQASIGIANGQRALDLRSGTLPSAGASLANVTLSTGYEFRFGRGALTPLIGWAFQDLTVMDMEGVERATGPALGMRGGLEVSVQGGYRIAFDRGPHVDLRVRVARVHTALQSYETSFAGGLWYAGLGIAIVYRPYIE